MALFGVASSPFSSTDSIQFTTLFSVQYYLASRLSCPGPRPIFRDLRHFLDVNSYSLSFSFMLCASDKLYLKALGQRPRTFDIANTNECFSDIPPKKDGIPWISREAYLETPLLHPQGLYGRRSLGRSYADVITKFSRLDLSAWLPFFINHGALLAHFARLSSAISKAMINHQSPHQCTNKEIIECELLEHREQV